MPKAGEIKLTTNYVVLLRYDGPAKHPFFVRTLPRTESNIELLKRLAKQRGIELLNENLRSQTPTDEVR